MGKIFWGKKVGGKINKWEKSSLAGNPLFLIAAERSYGRVMLWAHRRLHMHRERHFQDIHGSKQNRLGSIFVAALSLGLSPVGLSSGGADPASSASAGSAPWARPGLVGKPRPPLR